MTTTVPVLLLPLLATLFAGGPSPVWSQASPWTHKDIPGWSAAFTACAGSSQSPIDIDDHVVKHDAKLGGFKFNNYENKLAAKHAVWNSGRSLQVDVDGDITVSGGGLPGVYKLVQYHFHWGDEENYLLGGEHTHNGHTFPAELHLVHYNTKYKSVAEAVDKPEGLAVLGMWIKIGKVHEPMQELISYFQHVKSKPNGAPVVMSSPIRLLDLLPGDTAPFYRYSGSLTTPPCFESVVWTMFRQPIQISYSQMLSFHTLVTPEGDRMVNNYRPVQPLNSRPVYSSVKVRFGRSPLVNTTAAVALVICAGIVFMMYKYSKHTKAAQKVE